MKKPLRISYSNKIKYFIQRNIYQPILYGVIDIKYSIINISARMV